jgi:hypothetical protein
MREQCSVTRMILRIIATIDYTSYMTMRDHGCVISDLNVEVPSGNERDKKVWVYEEPEHTKV